MKIWYQSAASFGIDKRWRSYEQSLKRHISSLLDPASSFVLKDVDIQAGGPQAPKDLDEHRRRQFIQNAVSAESQGFDAFAIGCWKDYANVSLRNSTKILAVSIAESSLHASLILGRRPGIITPNVHDEAIIKENLKIYGIEQSKMLFSVFDVERDIVLDGFANPKVFSDHFIPFATELIDKGADALVLSWGVMSEVLYNMDLRNIGDIPIVDSMVALIGTIDLLKKMI